MKKEQYYIIRTDRAGVFFGQIKERHGSEATLINARKLHYWSGAAAVEQIAEDGVKYTKNCRFTITVPEITVLGIIQINPCSERAIANIKNIPEWKI
jgi:hypothetical protein